VSECVFLSGFWVFWVCRVFWEESIGGMKMRIRAALKKKLVCNTLDFVAKDPDANIDKLLGLANRFAVLQTHRDSLKTIEPYLLDKDSNWRQYVIRLFQSANPTVRHQIGNNFFVNAVFDGMQKQRKAEKRLGASVPFAVLLDPTSSCNLRCTGCWASDYKKGDNLSLELMQRIMDECRDLGIHFIVVSGGEPLVRKDDIVTLARNNPDMLYVVFTNGTLVDEQFAEDLAAIGNMSLVFSLEGEEANTDARRGKGVFQKVMHAMDLLREKGVLFGTSVTYTRLNVDEVSSDEFIDMLIDKGAAYTWFFTYVPVGGDANLDLMATPEQRMYMFDRVNYFRRTKPLFMLDFWNDGWASGGCIAGGRRYFHINSAGWVEPCAFIHYAVDNIKEKSLEEVLTSPLFKAYQKRQPFNENHLRPCPLIDNPTALRDIVVESKSNSTQKDKQQDANELAVDLQGYSKAWGELADGVWYETHERKAN
jgi:MoaA/NifB/PqqE/SkfB family radical SAM enzyme